jgi:2-polyprenyl-3-methyl-5-hydroxy-6-metoxy-1,4-benzoquinol methylase
MGNDHFKGHAADWDRAFHRIDNVDNISREMRRRIRFTEPMEIMDFGSGTGLLLERIASLVAKITAVDTSAAMNQQLAAKRDRLKCNLEILDVELADTKLDRRFDGIISSMTLHHIGDVPALFRTFHSLLKEDGFIAIADLDREDGSFHSEDTGVRHFGFDRDALLEITSDSGFRNPEISTASVIRKPLRDYPVFLLTAFR